MPGLFCHDFDVSTLPYYRYVLFSVFTEGLAKEPKLIDNYRDPVELLRYFTGELKRKYKAEDKDVARWIKEFRDLSPEKQGKVEEERGCLTDLLYNESSIEEAEVSPPVEAFFVKNPDLALRLKAMVKTYYACDEAGLEEKKTP